MWQWLKVKAKPQMSQVLPQDCAAGRTKFKILWGFSSPPLPTFIFLPVSYLFVAECISLTSLAVCVLLTWIALLLLNVCWLGVEKGIVSCCQSTRLQLQRILITHPPKISRWLLTSPARYIWRCLFFFPFWGACGTIKLNMRDGFGSLNLNLIRQSRYQCVLMRSATLRDHRHLQGRR